MARSRRKTPAGGNAVCESDKSFKVAEHRRERRKVRAILADDDRVLPGHKEFGDPWLSGKDGKSYYGSKVDPKLLRK